LLEKLVNFLLDHLLAGWMHTQVQWFLGQPTVAPWPVGSGVGPATVAVSVVPTSNVLHVNIWTKS
jgi:hypothetical protein